MKNNQQIEDEALSVAQSERLKAVSSIVPMITGLFHNGMCALPVESVASLFLLCFQGIKHLWGAHLGLHLRLVVFCINDDRLIIRFQSNIIFHAREKGFVSC